MYYRKEQIYLPIFIVTMFHYLQEVKYDVYLSYSPSDKNVLQKISNILIKKDSSLRVFDEHQQLDENLAWQEHIHKV